MAKLRSIGKLPSTATVIGERSLTCQTGGSNKFYTGVLAQDPASGEFIAGARFGRIGGPSHQSVMWYRGASRAAAEDAVAQMMEEKVYKGRSQYVTADGRSLSPLFHPPNPHPRPAPPRPGPAAAPATQAPAARPVSSMRDALSRRRGG